MLLITEVLKRLLDSEGTGINLTESPEGFINYLKQIINKPWNMVQGRVEQHTKD